MWRSIYKTATWKTCFIHRVMYEILQLSVPVLVNEYAYIFSHLLRNGTYPSIWCENMIKPIYNGGGTFDPNNNWGIAISSCFSKMFSKVLFNRLDKYSEDNSIIGIIGLHLHRISLALRITFVNSDRITNVNGRLSTSSASCRHASGSQLNRKACRPDRPSTNEACCHDYLGLTITWRLLQRRSSSSSASPTRQPHQLHSRLWQYSYQSPSWRTTCALTRRQQNLTNTTTTPCLTNRDCHQRPATNVHSRHYQWR